MADTQLEHGSGVYETRADANEDGKGQVKRWLQAIELASSEEKEWREDVEKALAVFRSDSDTKGTAFNIYHSNVETIIPALYNSTPIPDVRRRHGDKDPAAKEASQALERILSYSVDDYDFDGTMLDCVKDMTIASRGVARVTYTVETGPTEMAGQQVDDILYQAVGCEHVPWASFRRGPGRKWADVPWEAFAQYYTREALKKLSPKHGANVPLDMMLKDGRETAVNDEPASDIFQRALVWEIWDKEARKVRFIAPGYPDAELVVVDDPLGLEQFFCTPRPMMGGGLPADLRPICEFRIYCELLEELDSLTVRLRKLIKDLRVRGAAAGNSDLEKIATAGDGEIVEIADIAAFVNAGGLDKMITWWPLEQIIKVVKELYIQREQVKQSIYEITGIADIMRGASDPNETLGAQQIKTQWGSLRIQRRQAEVQRFARDIFRLKAEIVAKKFEPHIIADMVGFTPGQPIEAAGAMPSIPMQPPAAPGMGQMPQQGMNGMTGGGMLPGAPPSGPPPVTPEQVMALLKSDNMRKWRIDIETDSTIRADLTRNMESMAQFVQGSAQYFQAVAPIVQTGGMTQVAAVKIYSAFARNFKLGKEVDDILDKLASEAEQAMQAQAGKQPEDPKMIEMQGKMELEKQRFGLEQEKHQQEMAFKGQEMQMKMGEMQMNAQTQQQEMGMRREEMINNNAVAREGLQIKREGKDTGTKVQVGTGDESMQMFAQAIAALGKMMMQAQQSTAELIAQGNEQVIAAITAPKTITTPDGRAYTAITGTVN